MRLPYDKENVTHYNRMSRKNNGRSRELDPGSIPPDIPDRHSDSGQRFLLSRVHIKRAVGGML